MSKLYGNSFHSINHDLDKLTWVCTHNGIGSISNGVKSIMNIFLRFLINEKNWLNCFEKLIIRVNIIDPMKLKVLKTKSTTNKRNLNVS